MTPVRINSIIAGCLFLTTTLRLYNAIIESGGTKFVVAFLAHNSTRSPCLLLSPLGSAVVNVVIDMPLDGRFSPIRRALVPYDVTKIKLPAAVRMTSRDNGSARNKGIRIVSDGYIVAYARDHSASGVFPLLPVTVVGRKYLVTSFKPLPGYTSQLGIVGVSNATHVTLEIPTLSVQGHGRRVDLVHSAVALIGGYRIELSLNAHEVVQLRCECDLTGVSVTGNLPFGLTSGQTAQKQTSTGNDVIGTTYDFFIQRQLLPTTTWGRYFVTVQFSRGRGSDIFRIHAQQPVTEVDLRTVSSHILLRLTASANRHIDAVPPSAGAVLVESDGPVSLLQQWISPAGRLALEPQIPRRWREWAFLASHARGYSMIVVTVLVPAKQHLIADEILVDGVTSRTVRWTFIDGRHCRAGIARVSVRPGWHNVSLRNGGDVAFSAFSVRGLAVMVRATPEAATSLYDVRSASDDAHTQSDYVSFGVEEAPAENSINFNADERRNESEMAISATLLAVILSLSSAIFFVAVCILGFVAADYSYQHGYFRPCKVTPYTPQH